MIHGQALKTTSKEYTGVLLQLDEAQEETRKMDMKLNIILKAPIGLELLLLQQANLNLVLRCLTYQSQMMTLAFSLDTISPFILLIYSFS